MSGGRPQLAVEPWKGQIIDLVNAGWSLEGIRNYLAAHGVELSTKTLRRRLDSWSIDYRCYAPRNTTDDRTLQLRVETLTCEFNLRPKEILAVLEQDGMPISNDSLKVIRSKLGIKLRVDDRNFMQQQLTELEGIITDEHGRGHIEGFGRRLLQVYMRRHGYIYAR